MAHILGDGSVEINGFAPTFPGHGYLGSECLPFEPGCPRMQKQGQAVTVHRTGQCCPSQEELKSESILSPLTTAA